MHILILPSENYQTLCEPLGGIFVRPQAYALRRYGFQVGVVSSGFVPLRFSFVNYAYPKYENDNGIHTYRCFKRQILFERIALKLGIKTNIKTQLKLRLKLFEKYIKNHGMPDLIHAHDSLYAGYIAYEIKRKWHVPYILTEHSGGHELSCIAPPNKIRIRDAFIHADMRTAVSSRLANILRDRYKLDDGYPLNIIGNILDKRFEDTLENVELRKMDEPSEYFTFLNVASLDDNKAHQDLLSAFAVVFKSQKRVRLRIAGSGSLKRYLLQHAKNLGIGEQIVFLDRVSREVILSEMKNCHAFVLSSHFETFSVVLIEALACGKPVIATACGGPEEIVNESNGILIPPKNIDRLAEGMKQMLLNVRNYDPAVIRTDCVSRFGEVAFVEKLSQLYRQVLNKV